MKDQPYTITAGLRRARTSVKRIKGVDADMMKEIDKIYPEVEKDLIEFKLDELENKDEKRTEPDKNQKIFDLTYLQIDQGDLEKL